MCVNTPTLFFCHFIYRPTHTSTTCNYIIQSRKYCLTKYGLSYEGILFKPTRLYYFPSFFCLSVSKMASYLGQQPDKNTFTKRNPRCVMNSFMDQNKKRKFQPKSTFLLDVLLYLSYSSYEKKKLTKPTFLFFSSD